MTGGKMRFLTLAVIGLSFTAASTQAAEILNFPAPKTTIARPAGIPASCKEWTDSCRICAAGEKDVPACSNVGIACLPQKWRCTRP
jgi:hypothetical protein